MDIYFDDYPPWLSTKQEYLRTCSSVVLASAVYQKDALGFLLRLDEDKHQFTSVVSSDDYYLHSKNLNYTIGFKEDEVVVAFQFHPKNMKFLAPDSNIIQNVATSNVFQRGLFRTSLEIPLEPFIHLLQEGHKLVFTGHCYGGAIAIMIAARLMADQRVSENLKNIFCITFGAPLVTTDAIHTFIPMKQMNQHFHHYIHEEDFLPQILTIIQNAIHFDRNLVPELQKFVKNNLLSSLCVYRKSDELSFVTKFFASSPLSQLKAILQGVMDTMRNEYKPFGQYFLLKMPISDSMQQKTYHKTSLVSGDDIFLNAKSFFIRDPSLVLKKHSMEEYLKALGTRLQVRGGYCHERFSHGTITSTFFDPNKWIWQVHKSGSARKQRDLREFSFSILQIKMKDRQEIKVTIHGGYFLPLISKITLDDKEPTTHSIADSKLIFVFYLHIDSIPKQIKVYTHFGKTTFTLDPSTFLTGKMLEGKKKKISDLDVIDLYKYAFSYALFTGKKSFFKKEKRDNDKRTEVKNILISMEERWKKECSENQNKIVESEKFQKDLREQLVYIMKEQERIEETQTLTEAMEDEEALDMPTEVISIREIIQAYCEDETIGTAVEALIKALPHLLLLQEQLIPEIRIKGSLEAPILMGLGVGILAGGLVAVGWSIFAAFVGVTGTVAVSVIGVMMGIFKKEYEKRLNMYAESLGIFVDEIREHPFFFEEAIYHHCQKIGMIGKTREEIIQNWDKYFTGTLRHVLDNLRLNTLKVLESIWDHYRLRVLLFSDLAIGVVGTGKAGKSTLIKELFNFKTNPSVIKRTTDMKPYYPIEKFHIIDFPHLDSTKEKLKACFQANYQLVDAVIVVFDAIQRGDTNDQKRIISLLNKLNVEYLACFNKAEYLWLNDCHDDSEEEIDEEEGEEKRVLTIQELEDCRKDIYTTLNIPPEKCILTAFHPGRDVRDELENVNIKGPKDVMNWICTFLEKNDLSQEEIQQVREYKKKKK